MNRIIETYVNGQDHWQALVGENKLTLSDEKAYVYYGCNLDEIYILEIKLNDKIVHEVLNYEEVYQRVKELAENYITHPGELDGDFSDEPWINGEMYLDHLIEDSDDYDLIWAINKHSGVNVRKLDLDQFVSSTKDEEKIKEVLLGSNLLIK